MLRLLLYFYLTYVKIWSYLKNAYVLFTVVKKEVLQSLQFAFLS